jgi:potassium efflux system protein
MINQRQPGISQAIALIGAIGMSKTIEVINAIKNSCMVLLLSALLLLSSTLLLQPASAQGLGGENAEAPIVLDGRVVFKISSLDRFPATTRARQANDVLKQELKALLRNQSSAQQPESNPIETNVDLQDSLYTIQVNGVHLLTVTERDSGEDQSPLIQALIWKQKLDIAFGQAIWQRSPEYLQQVIPISLIVIIVAGVATICTRHLSKQGFGLLPRRFRLFIDSSKSVRSIFGLTTYFAQIAIWVGTAYYVTDLFPLLRSWRYRIITFVVDDTLDYPILNWGIRLFDRRYFNFAGDDCHAVDSVKAITKLFRKRFIGNESIDYRFQETITTLSQYLLTFIGLVVDSANLGLRSEQLWQFWPVCWALGLAWVCKILPRILSVALLFCSIDRFKWAIWCGWAS